MKEIAALIDGYSEALHPLKEAARRYLIFPSTLGSGNVLSIGHRPWVAELNYMLTLYPGINPDALDAYSQGFEIQVPEVYAKFLREVNGAFCFGMSLFGVPRSAPLLDRTRLQCHDLATAVRYWKNEYSVPDDFFHFGGRHYSFSQNVGYFIDGDQRIVCVKGKKKVIGEWDNFTDFLAEELPASEQLEEERRPSQWNR